MNKAKITILRRIENGTIILVTGAKAALKCQRLSKEENKDDMTIPMVMTLNEIPIVQMSPSYCPTCCGLLAAGYGIDNANCSELFEISNYINGGFTDLESLIETIKPLIGLFNDGVYLIRDKKHFLQMVRVISFGMFQISLNITMLSQMHIIFQSFMKRQISTVYFFIPLNLPTNMTRVVFSITWICSAN